MRTFRLNNVNLFLTYPQCPVDKDSARDQLTDVLRNQRMHRFAIAQEEHKDGGLHLHVVLCAVSGSRFDIKNANLLDLKDAQGQTYHGKYEKCRSVKAAWKYITKEDKSPLHNFTELEVQQMSAEKENMRSKVGKRILAGEQLEPLIEEYPQLIFGYKKLKEDIKAYQTSISIRVECPRWLPNTWGKLLPVRTDLKLRHFWIWSSLPNRGKTTFALNLKKLYQIPIFSGDFTYWALDGTEEVLIIDEYNHPALRFFQLNAICDGTFGFRVFHGGVISLPRFKMLIVLSNVCIRDLYPFKYDLLEARFKQIELL